MLKLTLEEKKISCQYEIVKMQIPYLESMGRLVQEIAEEKRHGETKNPPKTQESYCKKQDCFS